MSLPRELRTGSRGRDVLAIERALLKAGFWAVPVGPDNRFDSDTERVVRAFQRERGLGVDGVVGPITFGQLEPYLDRYGRWLLANVHPDEPPSTARQRIVAAAHHGYRNRSEIHYTQKGDTRRMQGVRERIRPPSFPSWEDCSSFATWCFWVSGAPDPNNNGFNGRDGYTGDQIDVGREVAQPRPGDLVFYGHARRDINHVTVYVGNGRVVSHGQESGPMLLPIDYNRGRYGPRQQIRSYLP